MRTLMIFFYLTVIASGNSFSQTTKTDSLLTLVKVKNGDTLISGKIDTIPYVTLYFYRSYIPKFNAPIKKVPIYVNDSLVYNLKANTIISLKVFKEGRLNIAVDEDGESEITIKSKFGNEYFFRCEIKKGLWFGKPAIEAVPVKVGKEESGIFKTE